MGPQTINVLAARTPEGESKYNQLRLSQRTHHGPLAQASHLEPTGAGAGTADGLGGTGDSTGNPPALQPERPTRVGLRTSTIPLNGALSERLRTAPPTPPIGFQSAPTTTPPPSAAPSTATPATSTPPTTALPPRQSADPASLLPPVTAEPPSRLGGGNGLSGPAFRPTTRTLTPPGSSTHVGPAG